MLEFTLRLMATLLGGFSSLVGAYLAFRASMIHRKAYSARIQAEETGNTRVSRAFEKLSWKYDTEAGWRPKDHAWLIASITGLATSYVLNLAALLLSA